MKYYKSFYLKNFNEIDLSTVAQLKFGYRAYWSSELSCMVIESLDHELKVTWVSFQSPILTKEIQKFYELKYKNESLLSIYEELENGIKITFFKDFKASVYSIYTFHEDGKPKLFQEFNGDFELLEYRQSIYDENGKHIEEKIFYANSWTIHREKML